MIDEGLWLVCYETKQYIGTGRYSTVNESKASFTLLVPEEWSSKKLWKVLEKKINNDSFAITNMVRLGDLEEKKDTELSL